MTNKIPRKFHRITGEMLICTSYARRGNIIHITKNNFGYLGYNTYTNDYFYIHPEMIKNDRIFKIREVVV